MDMSEGVSASPEGVAGKEKGLIVGEGDSEVEVESATIGFQLGMKVGAVASRLEEDALLESVDEDGINGGAFTSRGGFCLAVLGARDGDGGTKNSAGVRGVFGVLGKAPLGV